MSAPASLATVADAQVCVCAGCGSWTLLGRICDVCTLCSLCGIRPAGPDGLCARCVRVVAE